MLKTIKITEESQGERLDKFLTEYFKNNAEVSMTVLTRSQIQKLIKAGEVLVNGEKSAVHRFLRTDDTVEVKGERSKVKGLEKKPVTNYQLPVTKNLFKDVKIINNDKNFLIIQLTIFNFNL